MTQNINLNIVGTANFTPVYAEIGKLKTVMTGLQNTQIGKGFNAQLNTQLRSYEQDFLKVIESTKGFNVEQVKLADATDHLTTKLSRGQFNLGEYYSMFKRSRTGVVQELEQIAQAQAKISKSMVIPSQKGGYAQVITDMSGVADKIKTTEIYQKALNTAMMDGSTKLINFGKNTQWAGRQLTVGLTVPLAAAGGALATMFYQVDQNLRKMQAVYGVGGKAGGAFSSILPSQQEIASIRTQVVQLSQEMARTYGQTAQETAGVAADLAAAGYTGNQLLGLTKTVTKAMVLGESDRQTAMKATIALQSAYKLSTDETATALNFFSAAQAATSTTMRDLIDAIPRVGPVVRNLGGSYKDTVAMLVAMKEGGVAAGEGANALKNSLGRLISPTKTAVDSLKVFGVDILGIVNKNSGNVVGMIEALQQALSTLTPLARQQAITDIFGKFQMSRMTALLDNFNQSGTQSAKVMQMMGLSAKQLSDIAANQTKTLQDSTSGQFKIAIETLKADLMPIGETFLQVATVLIKAVDFIVKAFDKLGPIKYVLGALFGGAAVLGPIIMFSGLMANLVGQVFKLVTLFKMFRGGFAEGGGWSSPIKSLTTAFAGLSNYFQEVDKAMIASEALSKDLNATMMKQEDSLNILTAALTRYTNAVERAATINNISGGGIVPPNGGPAGGPIGPGGIPFAPTGGPTSPLGIVGNATRPTLPVQNPMSVIKSSAGEDVGRTGFGYTTPSGEKVKGNEFIHLVPDQETQNVLGKLAVVPGYFDLPNSPGVAVNRNLKDNPMPIIPPSMMQDEEIVKRVLRDLKLSTAAWSVEAHAPALSLENITNSESSKIAMLRAMQQMGPSVLPQLSELHRNGATGQDVHNFFSQAMGPEQWQSMRQQAIKDVLAAYESAQTSVHEQLIVSGRGSEIGSTAELQAVTSKFGSQLLNEYKIIVDNMDQQMVSALSVESEKTGQGLSTAIREGMRRNAIPALLNLGATASTQSDLIVKEFENLIQVAQQAMAKIASQVGSTAVEISAMSGVGTVPVINQAAARISRVEQIAKGGLGAVKLATGGKVQGPGGPRDDVIPAMLSDGEYVVNANAVGHYGTGFLDAVNTKKLASGGPARSSLSGIMDSLFGRQKMQSSAQIQDYLTSPNSVYTGNNIRDFFASRNGASNVDLAHIEDLIKSHKNLGTLEEQQLMKALEEHASGAWGNKSPLAFLSPQTVDVGRAALDARLSQMPGDTVRLYRSIATTPETGKTAPGHYGYLPAGQQIEKPQPYTSYSSDIESAIKFAQNTQIANARIVEVDVPKSSIVGIQGANYTGKPGEGEFIVRSSDVPSESRYITFAGLSTTRKNSSDPLLKFLAKPGPESKGILLSDIARRYTQLPSPEASSKVPGFWEESQRQYAETRAGNFNFGPRYSPQHQLEFFGITPEEIQIAQRHLEEKYGMSIKELAKQKNRKIVGKNYEDQTLLRLASDTAFTPADVPGSMSTVHAPGYINRADGGGVGKYKRGKRVNKLGKGWTLSELWASSGGENLFVNHLSQNEDLQKLVMSEIIDSKEIKQSSKDKLLSTIPFNLNPRNTDYAPTVEQDFSKILKKMLDENAFGEQNPDFYARLGATIAMPDYRSYTPSLLEQAGGNDKTIYGGLTSNGTVRRDAPYEFRSLSRQAASESMQIAPGYELDKRAMARDIVKTHFSDFDFDESFLAEIEKRLSKTYLNTHTAHGFARGSYVSGLGGPKDDMIPAMLSNGEYVVNADSVKHYGVGFMDSVNTKKLSNGGLLGFADGGSTVEERVQQVKEKVAQKAYDAKKEAEEEHVASENELKFLQQKKRNAKLELQKAVEENEAMKADANATKEARQQTADRVRKANKDLVEVAPSRDEIKVQQRVVSENKVKLEKANQSLTAQMQSAGITDMSTFDPSIPKEKGSLGQRLRERYKPTNGQPRKGFSSGMGSMMAGTALSMVGSMAGGALEANSGGPTMASQAMQFAGTGAMLGSMFGPEGTAIGAIGGAVIGGVMGKISENQRELAAAAAIVTEKNNGLIASYKASSITLQAFGITLRKLSDVRLGKTSQEVDINTQKINQLSDAYTSSNDESQLALNKLIKNSSLKETQDILKKQFYANRAAGVSAENASIAIAALAKANGKAGASVQTLIDKLNKSDAAWEKAGNVQAKSALAGMGNGGTPLGQIEKIKDPKSFKLAQELGLTRTDLPQGFEWKNLENYIPSGAVNAGLNFDNFNTQGFSGINIKNVGNRQAYELIGNLFGNNLLNDRNTSFKENVTGKDLLNSSNVDAKAIATLANINASDDAQTAFTKINDVLFKIGKNGPDALLALGGVQEQLSVIGKEFAGPISDAVANFDPKQFKEFVDGLNSTFVGKATYSAMGENGGGGAFQGGSSFANLNETGKAVLDQITSGLTDSLQQLYATLKNGPGSVTNFLSAVNLVSNGLDLKAGQIAAITNDRSGTLLAQATAQASFEQKGKDIGNAELGNINGANKTNALQEAAQKSSDDFAKSQKAAQRAYQKEQQSIQDNIKAKGKYIDSIRKEMDARQKLYDKKQQGIEQDLTLQNLQNDVYKARTTGSLLDQAAAQSAYNAELNKQADLKKKQAADEKDQSKIDKTNEQVQKLQDALDALSKKYDKNQQAAQDAQDTSQATYKGQIEQAQKLGDTTSAQQAAYSMGWSAITTEIEHGGKITNEQITALATDSGLKKSQIQADVDALQKQYKKTIASFNTPVVFESGGTMTALVVPNGVIQPDEKTGELRWVPGKGSKTLKLGDLTVKPGPAPNPQNPRGGGHDRADGAQIKAEGGYVSGPGTGTSDSIPARLSNGEYVVRANAVQHYGAGMMDAINTKKFAEGGIVGPDNVNGMQNSDGKLPKINLGYSVPFARGGRVSVGEGGALPVGGGSSSTGPSGPSENSGGNSKPSWYPPVSANTVTNGRYYLKSGKLHAEAWNKGQAGTGVNDIPAPLGAYFSSLLDGIVSYVGKAPNDQYYLPGYVKVKNDRGGEIRYAHMKPMVSVGQKVKAGDSLGTAAIQTTPVKGRTMLSPHLHFAWHGMDSLIQRGAGGRVPWLDRNGKSVFGSLSDKSGSPSENAGNGQDAVGSINYSQVQLVKLLQKAGFHDVGLKMAWAIAMRESGGRASARSPKKGTYPNGTYDAGLYQLNSSNYKAWKINTKKLYDGMYQAKFVYDKTKNMSKDTLAWGLNPDGTTNAVYYGHWSKEMISKYITNPFKKYWNMFPAVLNLAGGERPPASSKPGTNNNNSTSGNNTNGTGQSSSNSSSASSPPKPPPEEIVDYHFSVPETAGGTNSNANYNALIKRTQLKTSVPWYKKMANEASSYVGKVDYSGPAGSATTHRRKGKDANSSAIPGNPDTYNYSKSKYSGKKDSHGNKIYVNGMGGWNAPEFTWRMLSKYNKMKNFAGQNAQSSMGKPVKKGKERLGDLILKDEGNYNRVGIYVGEGKYVFADSPLSGTVKRSSKNYSKAVRFLADGGPVSGPGGAKDDKIPAMLSNGEFVVRADSVNSQTKPFLNMINAGTFNPKFNSPTSRVSTPSGLAESAGAGASTNNVEYNLTVTVEKTNASPEDIANVVIQTLKRKEKTNKTHRIL